MKTIKYKKRNKKLPIIIAASAAVVVLLAGGSYALFFRSTPAPSVPASVNTQPATTDQVDAANATKATNADTAATKSTDSTGSTSSTSTSSIDIQSVTAYNTGSAIQVAVNISTSLSSGTCTLTMSKEGSAPKTYTADVQFSGTYTTCKGFTIPLTDLSPGTWSLDLNVTSGSASGDNSATQVKVN